MRRGAWQWHPPPRPLSSFLDETKKMCRKVVIRYVVSLLWILAEDKLRPMETCSAGQGGQWIKGEVLREWWTESVLDTL
jgi:hypothetical protein